MFAVVPGPEGWFITGCGPDGPVIVGCGGGVYCPKGWPNGCCGVDGAPVLPPTSVGGGTDAAAIVFPCAEGDSIADLRAAAKLRQSG